MRSAFFLSVLVLALLSGCTATEAPPEEISQTADVPTVACVDSDGGQVESMKGVVTISGVSNQDSCEDSTTVREYYCAEGDVKSVVIPCSEGTTCEDGACIALPESPEAPPEPELLCSDSDGDDIYSYGVVSYDGSDYADSCQGPSDVIEYYCEDDAVQQRTANCGVGSRCEDGACLALEKTCSDPDSGDDSAAGTTTQYGGGIVLSSMHDSCIDENTRIEYYCEGDEIKDKTAACPEHEYCHEGACLPACQDFDSGSDYETPSYVKTRGGTFEDSCYDDDYLVEYYCSGDDVASAKTLCEAACYEARCLDAADLECDEDGDTTMLMFDDLVVEEKADECADYETAYDYFCDDDAIDYDTERCDDDELCVDGRCEGISSAGCYDLDDGDINTKSYAVETSNTSIEDVVEDVCFTDGIVAEAMCEGDSTTVEFIDCPKEEKCIDGACKYPYVCTETGTGSPYERGEATLSKDGVVVSTERDLCSNDSTQRQVRCTEDGRITYEMVPCPAGTTCDSSVGYCR